MGWPYRYGITVTVHRPTFDIRTRERSGEDAEHQLPQCLFDPGTTRRAESVDETIQTTPTVYAAYDADVLDADELTVPGTTGRWYLDGEVRRHRNDLTGRQACSEIRLTRRKGAQ